MAGVGNPGDWLTWATLVDIGVTESEPDGYDVAVSIVQAPRGGIRVRATLRFNGQVRGHLDVTGPLAQRLWPLIRQAAITSKGLG